MKQVDSLLLHNAGIEFARDGMGVYLDFHEEKYALPYRLAEWLRKYFHTEFTGTKNLVDEDFHIVREYQYPGHEDQLVAIYADVPQPGMLEIETHWSNDSRGESVDWKERITYCGSFSVKWKIDA